MRKSRIILAVALILKVYEGATYSCTERTRRASEQAHTISDRRCHEHQSPVEQQSTIFVVKHREDDAGAPDPDREVHRPAKKEPAEKCREYDGPADGEGFNERIRVPLCVGENVMVKACSKSQ